MRPSRQFPRVHRHTVLACSVAALLAVVAGCAVLPWVSEPGPEHGAGEVTLPAYTRSSSYSGYERPESPDAGALPHPAVPVRPTAWGDDGPEGAAAAARHFLDVHDFAFFSGHPIPIWELSAPDCVSGSDAMGKVWELTGMDQYAIFGEPTPQGEPVVEPDSEREGAWVVELREERGGVQRLNKYGEVIGEALPGAQRTAWVTLVREDAKWQVLDLGWFEVD